MALIDEAFDALADLRAAFEGGGEIGCHVFLHAQRGRDRRERWQRLSMDSSLSQRFAEATREAFTELQVRTADDQALSEFDFDDMVSGSVGVLRVSDAGPVAEWLEELPTEDWDVRFSGDKGYLDKVRFYATRLNFPDGRMLRVFRGKRGLDVVVEAGGGIAAFFRQEAEEMRPVDGVIVSFDQKIDFFEWGGFIFVLNLAAFESLTNLRDVTISKAWQAVDALTARFTIANAEAVKIAIGQKTKLAKKLASAVQHGLFQDIDGDAMIARIEAKNLGVRCHNENGSFVFDLNPSDGAEIEEFVNLITDFYLQSPVTNREWRALVKRPA